MSFRWSIFPKPILMLLALAVAGILASSTGASTGEAILTAYPDPLFNAVGSTRSQVVGVSIDGSGPLVGVDIQVTVTGSNSASDDCTTESTGLCEVEYVGQNVGVDTITATSEVSGTPVQDQITTEWVDSPANDDFSEAIQIPSLPFTDSVINVAASIEPSEPNGCGSMDKTVWYRISVDEPTTIAASTDDSDFTTSLAVYQGSSLAALSLADCDQFDPGPPPPGPSIATANGDLESLE